MNKIFQILGIFLLSQHAYATDFIELNTKVIIKRLRTSPHYNNKEATVVSFHHASRKYDVRLNDQEQNLVRLKEINIERLPESSVMIHSLSNATQYNNQHGTIRAFIINSDNFSNSRYVIDIRNGNGVRTIRVKEKNIRSIQEADISASSAPSENPMQGLTNFMLLLSEFAQQYDPQNAPHIRHSMNQASEVFQHIGQNPQVLTGIIMQMFTSQYDGGAVPANQAGFSSQEAQQCGSLSTFQTSAEQDLQATKCCICLSEFIDGEQVKTLPCDCHTSFFHPDCIHKWLEKSSTCPTCRKNFRER